MNEEMLLLKTEMADLKKEIETLTLFTQNLYRMLIADEFQKRGLGPEEKTEVNKPKVTWVANQEYSEEGLAKWKEFMQTQLEKEGYPKEQIATLLLRIQEGFKKQQVDPLETEADNILRNMVTKEQRKTMEETNAKIGILVSTLDIKGPSSYSVYGIVDNKQKFLKADLIAMAQYFSVFANEQRLTILKALFEHGEMTASQLQEKTGIPAGGQFYHHLREIATGGLLAKTKRGSYALNAMSRGHLATMFAVGMNNLNKADETKDIAMLMGMLEGLTTLDPTEIEDK